MTDDWRVKNIRARLAAHSHEFEGDAVSIKLRPLRRNTETGELEQAYVSGFDDGLRDLPLLRMAKGRSRGDIEIKHFETGLEIITAISTVVSTVAGILQIIDFFSKRAADRPDGAGRPIEAISVETRRVANGHFVEKKIAVVKPGEAVTPSSPVGKHIGKNLDIKA